MEIEGAAAEKFQEVLVVKVIHPFQHKGRDVLPDFYIGTGAGLAVQTGKF